MTAKLRLQRVIGLAASTAIALNWALVSLAKPANLQAKYADSQINVRSAPSTAAAIVHVGAVGDRVEVVQDQRGRDGATWHQVRLPSRLLGWVRSDLVQMQRSPVSSLSGAVPAIAANPSISSANTKNALAVRPQSLGLSSYTPEQINYFLEVAMGNEFGESTSLVKKWQSPIRIKVHGAPTSEDWQTLQTVTQELKELTGGLQLQIVQDNPNLDIYFVSEREFRHYEPNYQPLNYGFFWTHWNNQNTIYNARILISTVGISQKERSHLIREELTQSLGLMQDSQRYRDSIFFQGWTDPTEYTEIDKAIIRMLYHPDIQAGMTRSQVMQVLSQWQTASLPSAATQAVGDRAPLDFSLPPVPEVSR